MITFDIYLIMILDNIKYFCYGIIVFTTVCLVISFMIWLISLYHFQLFTDDEFENTNYIKKYKFFPIVCIILLTLSAVINMIIPTSKQMAIIYIVPKVVNNETIQQLSGNSMKLLDKYIKDLLNDDDNEKRGK